MRRRNFQNEGVVSSSGSQAMRTRWATAVSFRRRETSKATRWLLPQPRGPTASKWCLTPVSTLSRSRSSHTSASVWRWTKMASRTAGSVRLGLKRETKARAAMIRAPVRSATSGGAGCGGT